MSTANSPSPELRTLVVASGNPKKRLEMERLLSGLAIELRSIREFPDITEPEENGETFLDNAQSKALEYAQATGQWCVADDSGLVVDALAGAPGVHSARYAADEVADPAGRDIIDGANNAKLLRELAQRDAEQRTARFVCCVVLASPTEVLFHSQESTEGSILTSPQGDGGFGYDPLFFSHDLQQCFAVATAAQKDSVSHRGRALKKLATFLSRRQPSP